MKPNFQQHALNYALADASDPFAYSRAMSHLRSGTASYTNDKGEAAFYSATPVQVTKTLTLPNGKTLEWSATEYHNIIRP